MVGCATRVAALAVRTWGAQAQSGKSGWGLVALQLHVLPKDLSGTMAPHKMATVNQVRVEWRPIEMTTMEERVVNGIQWGFNKDSPHPTPPQII